MFQGKQRLNDMKSGAMCGDKALIAVGSADLQCWLAEPVSVKELLCCEFAVQDMEPMLWLRSVKAQLMWRSCESPVACQTQSMLQIYASQAPKARSNQSIEEESYCQTKAISKMKR